MSNAKADFCKIYVKFSGFPIVSIHPYRPKERRALLAPFRDTCNAILTLHLVGADAPVRPYKFYRKFSNSIRHRFQVTAE